MNPVTTERLTLRCVEPEDAAAFTRLITAEISRWLGSWPYPFTPTLAAEKIDTHLATAGSGDALPFVITRRDDAEVLGWICVYRKEEKPGRGVLSYWLGEAFQRQGILREAGAAAMEAGFERFDLDAIEASILPGNAASVATLRSLGLTWSHSGTVWAATRQRHEVCDYYHRLRPAASSEST